MDNRISAMSFSSPPTSAKDKPCIPDDEVISYFITDDNTSLCSNKIVRFQEDPQNDRQNRLNPQFSFKYRKQRSIPVPERVQEDLIGENSGTPYGFRIKEDRHQMNKSTNMLEELNETNIFNGISLQNSYYQRTTPSIDYFERINQLADELVCLVKNYLNDISDSEKHFTFDEYDDNNRLNLQQKVLQKALEHLNFKLAVQTCSPISRFSVASPHFEEIPQLKEIQLENEELKEQNDLLKDKIDILDMKIEQAYEKEQNQQLQMKLLQQQLEEMQKSMEIIQKNKEQAEISSEIINKQPRKRTRTTNSFHDVNAIVINRQQKVLNSQQHSPRKETVRTKLELDDGTTYIGGMNNRKKEGYGILKKGDQDIYMGFWNNDKFNGFGQLRNLDCPNIESESLDLNLWENYQGEFKNGLFDGYGILTMPNKSRFHGLFKEGKANGKGTYYSNNKNTSGIWQNNQKIR